MGVRCFRRRKGSPAAYVPGTTILVPPSAPMGSVNPVDWFWWHQYDSPPGYASCAAAVAKGGIPIFKTMDWGHAEYANRQEYAANFSAAHGNCRYVLMQNFWSVTANASKAYDTSYWDTAISTLVSRVPGRVMIGLDFEPIEASLVAVLNTEVAGKLGVSATAEQAVACKAWLASKGVIVDFSYPELRPGDDLSIPLTNADTPYTLLPSLAPPTGRINAWTIRKGCDYSYVDTSAPLQIGVALPPVPDREYTPAEARQVWPGCRKVYYPKGRSGLQAADELVMIAQL
jgi:hypothetical protein